MSDAFAEVAPGLVAALGGRQSARTLHFVLTVLLSAFLVVHLAMVYRAGFASRVRAMVTGRAAARREDSRAASRAARS
jgi:thiosulfate reductase cytochrome b subunit